MARSPLKLHRFRKWCLRREEEIPQCRRPVRHTPSTGAGSCNWARRPQRARPQKPAGPCVGLWPCDTRLAASARSLVICGLPKLVAALGAHAAAIDRGREVDNPSETISCRAISFPGRCLERNVNEYRPVLRCGLQHGTVAGIIARAAHEPLTASVKWILRHSNQSASGRACVHGAPVHAAAKARSHACIQHIVEDGREQNMYLWLE
jgi:hypothetical protein